MQLLDVRLAVLKGEPIGVADEAQIAAFRSEAQVGVVLPEQDSIFGPTGKHPVGLIGAFRDEVINEHTDVGFVAGQRKRGLLFDGKVGVDSCDQALAGGLFVSSGSIDLSCEVQVGDRFCLQAVVELGRWEVVVFHSIPWSKHSGLLEARDFSHGRQLCFFGQRGRESIEVRFDGVAALRLDEDLVSVFVRESVDLVFNAGAIPGAFACDGA